MKYLYVAVTSMFLCHSAKAQYEMDLKKINVAPLNYLNKEPVGPKGQEIRVNNIYMEQGGKPTLPVMGEFHYVRMDHRYWRNALLKMKASGVNIVSTYVMWSLHEEIEGQENWSGNHDLRKFILLCAELGMTVHLRMGPYCNAEIQHGALPDWIVNNKALVTRSNDPLYLNYSRKWYQSVYKQVKGLFYKSGGPIIAVQLENEFVKKGLVISHLLNLKKLAVDIGFDVPLYTMTHWMDSEYPKGEIVPYAGFYIETPWVTNNGKMTPATNFEYFTYNRLSDNIGTDIIKVEGGVESFDGSKSDSPFFTCEIGVGAPSFYHRRAIVPEGMAGENINLRLGTGVNLMGYYMYVGGTNPSGVKNTYGNGPYFGYDYQAPIREFGTLGVVMKETKKLNYFMNEFGSNIAPMLAYLPVSNKDKDNLQWSVRSDGQSGYVFVSNHLYRYDRPQFDQVQFNLKLKNETLTFPRKPVSIVNKSYFLWPFNLDMQGVTLKYGTVQPITTHREGQITSYFFFEDDAISAEYLIDANRVKSVTSKGAKVTKEKKGYFVSDIVAGKESILTITKNDGQQIRLVTLTQEQSDYIWKGQQNQKDFVAITSSSLVIDDDNIKITAETPEQQVAFYSAREGEGFTGTNYQSQQENTPQASYVALSPMHYASWVHPKVGHTIGKTIDATSLSPIAEATIRYSVDKKVKLFCNDKEIPSQSLGDYFKAVVTGDVVSGKNKILFESVHSDPTVVAEVEILYKNGVRTIWNTDDTWLNADQKPSEKVSNKTKPVEYAAEERYGVFELSVADLARIKDELRLEVSFYGDMATAYIGSEPFTDCYNDGAPWILGLTRYKEQLSSNALTLRIKGFGDSTENIFLEDNVDRIKGQHPAIQKLKVAKDYQYTLD
ncbi:beta-galactosidase [Sphingobacterium kitahiroshimense]|uniref:Beta-galactosidase n=1 Tax=Sphingobacterium kitahiroshimense TaxID=470446 RepID=A0ABV0C132_9SPHI